jgi:hypothetical protein
VSERFADGAATQAELAAARTAARIAARSLQEANGQSGRPLEERDTFYFTVEDPIRGCEHLADLAAAEVAVIRTPLPEPSTSFAELDRYSYTPYQETVASLTSMSGLGDGFGPSGRRRSGPRRAE